MTVIYSSDSSRCIELRKRYPVFTYQSFSTKRESEGSLRITFQFEAAPDLRFSPTIEILSLPVQIDTARLNELAFQLGLVESLSYWKATCSPTLQVNAGALNESAQKWWEELIALGMREFYYRNRIDIALDPDFVRVRSSNAVQSRERSRSLTNPSLLLLSGGKDSAVSIELLKRSKLPFRALLLNPTKAALDLARKSEAEGAIIARRVIDRELLRLNKEGYLNGHTPFSAYLAFFGLLVADALGAPHVIASNERSSDDANADFHGFPVNHQFSKSFDFETRFRSYAKALGSSVEYFSLLRPLYELQILQEFARHRSYFKLFRSCNRSQNENGWCGECPKCLFTFIALSVFVERSVVLDIFGTDLLENSNLQPILWELLGRGDRPFECVGTVAEVSAALVSLTTQIERSGKPLPKLLQEFKRSPVQAIPSLDQILTSWTDAHNIPLSLLENVRSCVVINHASQ